MVQLATDSMRVAKMQTWEFWERAGNWGGASFYALGDGGCLQSPEKIYFQIIRNRK